MIVSFGGRTYDMRQKAILVTDLKRNDIVILDEKLFRVQSKVKRGDHWLIKTLDTEGKQSARVWNTTKAVQVYRRNF